MEAQLYVDQPTFVSSPEASISAERDTNKTWQSTFTVLITHIMYEHVISLWTYIFKLLRDTGLSNSTTIGLWSDIWSVVESRPTFENAR
jgi:hypothetical protein